MMSYETIWNENSVQNNPINHRQTSYGLKVVKMKVKDLERTVNVAWSPATQYPIMLAAGTAAQQLDASFNTSACLELYSLNLTEPGMDMELKASVPSDHRFHKIAWGSHGVGIDQGSGIIVGGCDSGLVQMYSASKLIKGEDSLVSRQDKHTGPVHALDFNPFQHNLLATGASESEIYIWDLNNTTTPMTPGSKSQPLEDVQCISWNRQVQHILATTFCTRCVVWDLRKNEPIIKLTDTSSHIRWKVVAWHPEVATQLCLASEEDQAPVIQMWDLRFATSPLKVLENHTRGVLSVAWCTQDPDLLISCGKDNRILCWNPNSNTPRGEVLSEVAQTIQWNFDVAWCPRNPALIAASNFDGHVSIYSLMGGKQEQVQTSNKIADSFPGMDGYVQAPAPQQAPPVSVDLTKPPKWLKRPACASFGFGGKLLTVENILNPASTQQPGQAPSPIIRTVNVFQIITEPELIEKSNQLEQALQSGNYIEYCRMKADEAQTNHERFIWYFIKANFEQNPKEELLNLLGYKPDDINMNLSNFIKKSEVSNDSINHITDQLNNLNKFEIEDEDELTNDLLDGGYDPTSTFDVIAADNKYAVKKSSEPFKIHTGNDVDGLISQALILGNVEAAVELCLDNDRMADALIIAMTGGPELLARTQFKYLQQSKGYVSSLISALVSEDWSSVINNCDIESWKEALAAALTHSNSEEFASLCERLGERLESENRGNQKLHHDAQLCYICAGSFNKLVSSWSSNVSSTNPDKLQEYVELVTFLQKAVEQQGKSVEVSGKLAELLSHYASLLASQGSLNTALGYLGSSQDPKLNELRDRLYYNLGLTKPVYNTPQTQSRMSNPRVSVSNYSTQQNQFTPPANLNQNFQFNTNAVNNNQPQFNTGLPKQNTPVWQQQNTPTSFPSQPPKTFTPAPNVPLQPPRPTSVGSAHGGSGITNRVKYVVDPSVQSNPYGGMRTTYGNTTSPLNNPMAPPPVPLVPTQPTFSPGGVSNSPYGNMPPPPVMNSGPLTPNFSSPGQFTSPIQTQPTSQSFNENVEVAQPAINAFAPPPMNAPPGWNDPPMVSRPTRSQIIERPEMSARHSGTRLWKNKLAHEPKPEYVPQAPITHPLFGASPQQAQEQIPTNNGYPDMPVQGAVPFNQNPYTQGSPMPPPSQPRFPPPVQQPQFQPSTPTMKSSVASTPEPPKSKGPVPEEHMYLQTVFDELRNQCTCAANNPQTKRKLDDVAKKLETLYDMLREHKLSQNTLDMLHQIVQLVQIGDYAGGLNLHTQLVSGSDFAQIASFMPGLKVLMQCALQLNVYLR